MYFNVATTGKAIQAKEEPHSTQAKSTQQAKVKNSKNAATVTNSKQKEKPISDKTIVYI